jgi:DNA-binding CsgD family transcriptional regulator
MSRSPERRYRPRATWTSWMAANGREEIVLRWTARKHPHQTTPERRAT